MTSSDEFISIHEMRRRAPLHYVARADNARYVAFVLHSRLPADLLRELADSAGYGGSPNIAMYEGFAREAALALELIIKAVIAQKLELGVAAVGVTTIRMTHDVLRLWEDAGLTTLSREDQALLLSAKRILIWSGRYAAPKTDADIFREEAAYDKLFPRTNGELFRVRKDYFDWNGFDRIYGMAANEFWDLRQK